MPGAPVAARNQAAAPTATPTGNNVTVPVATPSIPVAPAIPVATGFQDELAQRIARRMQMLENEEPPLVTEEVANVNRETSKEMTMEERAKGLIPIIDDVPGRFKSPHFVDDVDNSAEWDSDESNDDTQRYRFHSISATNAVHCSNAPKMKNTEEQNEELFRELTSGKQEAKKRRDEEQFKPEMAASAVVENKTNADASNLSRSGRGSRNPAKSTVFSDIMTESRLAPPPVVASDEESSDGWTSEEDSAEEKLDRNNPDHVKEIRYKDAEKDNEAIRFGGYYTYTLIVRSSLVGISLKPLFARNTPRSVRNYSSLPIKLLRRS